MGFSLQGLNVHISSDMMAHYWLSEIYTDEIRGSHIGGDFHLHDLGLLATYCEGWDLKDLLTRGFRGVEGKIASSPPKHLSSALGQIVNFFFTLQGESAGAQAMSNFDTLLSPYIKTDRLEYSEIKQLMQEFIFNLNVPTRVGFQSPFSNLSFDLFVPNFLKDEYAMVDGKPADFTYGECQEEMNLLNRAFCEVMCEGDSDGRIFTFPIPTYNVTKEFDPDDANLESMWKMTAKFGLPYFSNFINSDLDPEDVRSMCCRLRLNHSEIRKRGGGLFGSNPLTGSIGVVTLNLSRVAYLSENEDEFFSRLSNVMDIAKDSLEIKRKKLDELTEQGLFPYSSYYLHDIKLRFGSYWANHFSTIGIIGMNEACLNMYGFDITFDKSKKFAQDTLKFIQSKLLDYQRETGNLYNLEATPAEGCSYRLAKMDKAEFPDIITAGTEEAPSYSNSTQLPVNCNLDLFESLNHQDDLQTLYTGGTVFHCFLGEAVDNPEVIKRLVMKIANGYRMPYFTITPTFSVCNSHGYLKGRQDQCSICGERTEVYSRIVGYFRPVKQWNKGKKREFEERKTFVAEESCVPSLIA
jgi:ribonucleoside-triphosphate reductase